MDINDLTLGQIKEIQSIKMHTPNVETEDTSKGLNGMVGKKVIIRTYSAGVWFGVLSEKSGNEVILTKARRMWRWWAKQGISLSAVALYGIKQDKSKIVEPVPFVWLEAIEIIPCREPAVEDLEGAENVKAE